MRAFIKDITREELDYILFKVLRISGNREVTFIEFVTFLLIIGVVFLEIHDLSQPFKILSYEWKATAPESIEFY